MKHLKLFEAFGLAKEKKIDVTKSDDIEYVVRYEREVDGEHDNDKKYFKGLDQLDAALRFAKEKYSSVDFEIEIDGQTRSGFVSDKKEHYIFGK